MTTWVFNSIDHEEFDLEPHSLTFVGDLRRVVKGKEQSFKRKITYQIVGTDYQLRRAKKGKGIVWYPHNLKQEITELDFATVLEDLLLGSRLGFLQEKFDPKFLSALQEAPFCSYCNSEVVRAIRRGDTKLRFATHTLDFFTLVEDKLVCQVCMRQKSSVPARIKKEKEAELRSLGLFTPRTPKKRSNYLGSFTNLEIVPFLGVNFPKKELEVNGKKYLVFTNSIRLLTLANSQDCACCGLKGVEWRITMHLHKGKEEYQGPHLNLFSECGTMLTCDHVTPKSKGGENSLDNTQTLCTKCNKVKSDKIINLAQLKKLRGLK